MRAERSFFVIDVGKEHIAANYSSETDDLVIEYDFVAASGQVRFLPIDKGSRLTIKGEELDTLLAVLQQVKEESGLCLKT